MDAKLMRRLIAGLFLLLASVAPAAAAGCGTENPNCIVPNRPVGDSTNAAANTRFVTGAVAGSGLTVGSSGISGGTNGNILYDNSGTLGERVPSGTGTTVATATGTLTSGDCVKIDASGNFVDAGAACASATRVLLNTLTASNSASLTDTTSLTATYDRYQIVFQDILPVTNGVAGRIRYIVGGVTQTTGYISGGIFVTTFIGPTDNIPFGTTTANIQISNAAPGVNATFILQNPSGSGKHMIYGTGSYRPSVAAEGAPFNSSGWYDTAGVVTGLDFSVSTGNISSGTIKIYGMK